MGRQVTESTKIKQRRGTGTGANYLPWIKTNEYKGRGIATAFPDWKHGRMIELLTQAQLWWYVKLRWNDDVVDIRENYPLPKSETDKIAHDHGFRIYANGRCHMVSDLVVTLNTGRSFVVAVISDINQLEDRRLKEKLIIERDYWQGLGISWHLVVAKDLERTEIMNIMDVVSNYRNDKIYDKFSLARHLIAQKAICVDLTKEIDYVALIKYLEETEIWKKYSSMLG